MSQCVAIQSDQTLKAFTGVCDFVMVTQAEFLELQQHGASIMILIFLAFNIFGLAFLLTNDFENSGVMFFSNLIMIFGYLLLERVEQYTNTNQFTDGQHAAIEQYNEDTK
ncbi:hypothetical protein D172_020130 (plasmid) [Pseudoalteromonas sp. Bsw20308]|uniref:hypothetical protein n=1 Tax=Pseudoalteromonas sp. Bsw20308 TaxID=283699 RepID=UPI000517DC8C|nr:hypothetical protein [Pseudoalteromonas sp. Bsw20308]ALQ10378.1 hypothetical protein D172_020130 [Pseudoalteromonas sp. Bsw20308]